MTDRDKKLLVYLAALLVLAAAYFFVGKPYLDKIEQLDNQKRELSAILDEKQRAYDMQKDYKDGISQANEEILNIIDKFPEDNTDEKSIMFIANMEKDIQISVSRIDLADDTISLIGGENLEQSTESMSEEQQAQVEEAVESVEAEVSESPSDGEGGALVNEEVTSVGLDNLVAKSTGMNINFTSDYREFKDFLAYIRDYEDRMIISEMDVSYEGISGTVSGRVNIVQYALNSPTRILPEIETNVESLGTSNVFAGNVLFAGSGDGESDSEVLELEDYFVKLNGVTDNTNGKTVGKADDIPGETYILSNVNNKEELSFNITGSGGDYSVTYKLGSVAYTDELRGKPTDSSIVIRVISTSRMGDSDNVEVSLHVTNQGDIPVVIAIEGDDSAKPRVNVVEKNGDVNVNNQ